MNKKETSCGFLHNRITLIFNVKLVGDRYLFFFVVQPNRWNYIKVFLMEIAADNLQLKLSVGREKIEAQ